MIKIKDESWSSIRISEEELRDLHEIKNIVEKSIGEKIRLGEALSYALRQLKSGRFESVNVKELREKIEVDLRGIGFQFHPPSLKFELEIDNRNTRELRTKRVEYRISSVEAYVFHYLPISIPKEVEFGAVEKRTLQLTVPMDCYLIDFLHTFSEAGGGYFPTITLWVNLHFTLGAGETGFTLSKELKRRADASRWKHMMETWKERFPKTLHEYNLMERKP